MASVGLPNYGTQNAAEKFPGIQQPDRPFSGMLGASYLGLRVGDKVSPFETLGIIPSAVRLLAESRWSSALPTMSLARLTVFAGTSRLFASHEAIAQKISHCGCGGCGAWFSAVPLVGDAAPGGVQRTAAVAGDPRHE